MLKFKIVPLCHSKIKHFRAQTKFFSDIFISLNTFSLTLIGESPKSGGETTDEKFKIQTDKGEDGNYGSFENYENIFKLLLFPLFP